MTYKRKANYSISRCLSLQIYHVDTGIDMDILAALSGVLAVVILTTNTVVFRYLYREKRTRANYYFMVITISDWIIGLISAPNLTFMMLANVDIKIRCVYEPVIVFFSYFPFTFSMLMTLFMSFDRCVYITKKDFHTNYMTKRVIILMIILLWIGTFTFSLCTSLFGRLDDKENIIHVFQAIIICLNVIISTSLSLYLLKYVLTSGKLIANNSSNNRRDKDFRLTVTITLMIFVLIVCNMPFSIASLLQAYYPYKSVVVERDVFYGSGIAIYINCCLNGMILYCRRNRVTSSKSQKRSVTVSSSL